MTRSSDGSGLRIALVAGEISGDILGAAIIDALKAKLPAARFYGVAGPRMVAAGCEAIESIEALSVMGLAEVVGALPRLLRLRAGLVQRFSADRPDLLIGIDAPDFNLGLERRLRDKGLRTAHVVSPTVWAWRAGRVKTIARAVDRILCLFPFEPAFYAQRGVAADYIGHPLADQIDSRTTQAEARARLGIAEGGPVLAVLPGSRHGEVKYLARPYAEAVARLHARVPGLRVVTPVAKPGLRAAIETAIATYAPAVDWMLIDNDSRGAMQVADVVLLASGTATLECLLLGRPMVVGYRTSALTAFLMLKVGLLKTPYVSLPNLLCREPVVTELLQEQATPDRFCEVLYALMADASARDRQLQQFDEVRQALRCDAAARAADVLIGLLTQ